MSCIIFFADFRFLGFIRVEGTADESIFKLESEHHNDESAGSFSPICMLLLWEKVSLPRLPAETLYLSRAMFDVGADILWAISTKVSALFYMRCSPVAMLRGLSGFYMDEDPDFVGEGKAA